MTDLKNDPTTSVTGPEPDLKNPDLPVGLPMPRDMDMLMSADKRVHVSHFGADRYPFPMPNGWFIVAEASDLVPGEAKAIYYFGRDLVVFRGESGKPSVVDAHCPHLGAHLAVGGKVEDDCIRCPFHGWKFDGESGACVDIPYGDSTRIPPKANARSYPTIERNHMIWAWYHERGDDPFYDVPEVSEFHSDDWTSIIVKEFEVNVAAQDMAENNVDFAHFRYVHGTEGIPEDDFTTDGTYKKTIGNGGDFVREGYGLGLGVLRVKDFVTFLSSTTPIAADRVHVRWIFTSPAVGGDDLAQTAVTAFCEGVSHDIPIWENKQYKDPPIITKSEKLILEHRRWAAQFYSDPLDPADGVQS